MVFIQPSFILPYTESEKDEFIGRSQKFKKVNRNKKRTGKCSEYIKRIKGGRCGCGRYC